MISPQMSQGASCPTKTTARDTSRTVRDANVVHRLRSVVFFVTCFTGSFAQAASYQKRDGTLVEPILDTSGSTHPYDWTNLGPHADAPFSRLDNADLLNADLLNAGLDHAKMSGTVMTGANLDRADLWNRWLQTPHSKDIPW